MLVRPPQGLRFGRLSEDEEDAAPDTLEQAIETGDRRLPDMLGTLRAALAAGSTSELGDFLRDLHEADAAEFINFLPEDERVALIRLLGPAFDFNILTEVDKAVMRDIVTALSFAEIAAGIVKLDSDDAVLLLSELDAPRQIEVLSYLPALNRLHLERHLEYPEESAGRRMQTNFIAVPPFWTVGQTIDYIREADDLPARFSDIYVIDPSFRFLGTLGLDLLMRARRPVRINDLYDSQARSVTATEDQEKVARLFERYDMLSVPVCDDDERLIGTITHDDIVDVIKEEAGEDMLRLSGVGDEQMSDSVINTTRTRMGWLIVNLATAIFAAVFVKFFEQPIQKKVELAILMGIIASMGGNAATQTMTVVVRAIATRELHGYRARRAFARELLVGLINGVVLALICGLTTLAWFGDFELGMVVALALFFNHIVAGIAGFLVPISLEKAGIDPAVASGVFVTTVTDVIGFSAFLLIASLWFGLW